jgi:hypothetical protein
MFLEVRGAEHVRGYVLRLEFNDGAVCEVDLSDALRGEVFEPLRDLEFFSRVAKPARSSGPMAPTSLRSSWLTRRRTAGASPDPSPGRRPHHQRYARLRVDEWRSVSDSLKP